jgi:dienelactone hydrolase
MLRKILSLAMVAALVACASAPQEPTVPAMAGGYDPVVTIPLDGAKPGFATAAYFEPQGPGPFPAVIILSGCGGVGDDVGIVKRVNQDYLPKGIATLVLDSFTPRGFGSICGRGNLVDVHTRANDAYAAMAWLDAHPQIDANHIFLQGYSHGASAAIDAINPANAAAHAQRFAGVVAFYPYCFSAASRFPVPTILLIGSDDTTTPLALCRAIRDKTNALFTVYPGAGHAFATPGQANYREAAAADAQRRAAELIDSLLR